MALRDWSARQVGRAWLLGLGLQLGVIAAWNAYGRLTESPEQREVRLEAETIRRRMDSVRAVFDAEDDSIARGLRPPRPTLSAEQRAELRQWLRDSAGITWTKEGNETTLHLPPPLAQEAGRVVTQLGEGLSTVFLIAALLLLPIPLTLLVLTGVWLVLRRPWRRPPEPRAAV